ncbi:kinesin-like protein KIF19 isoform X3 [Eurytemora carolleeae]|uniref:kinesin-like protein KIF19 isoform X3 n=1 Tax=Eurytemora carolleeae TaxID=1294199 RepID=UPI000C77D28E|nr:kinesin-like protein KIF19 isoform X3 [Eurytemora carolleeae]|eukprot:XP_023342688.1 kinesin-like protein KIF19 isoform X3 [Eurytemora affinis]
MVKNNLQLKGRLSPLKSPARVKRRSLSSRSASTSSASGTGSAAAPLVANINVAVRVRPENSREEAGAFRTIVDVVDKNMLVFDPQDGDDEVFFFKGKRQGMRDLNKKEKKDKKFTFDNVYGQESTNQEIFEGTTKNVVNTLFDGYNCCVFAYGATGAGKTHTMLGSKDNPGIVFLTMAEIFNKIDVLGEETHFEIFMSYLEVYNEGLRDLLDISKVLVIREDNKNGTSISGLSIHKPSGPAEVLNLLSYGNSNRSQHPTDHNKESSRSHAVLQIIVQQKPKDSGLSAEVKTAKLSMIDLAGSEKGTATGHKGARFREGANINKSLLALGNCINALASGSKYIPYRASKLTRLLKDSIGGNCATVMIANISPSSQTYEDTLNTLKYADRAKQIKIDLKKNVMNVDFHVAQYAKIVEDLRTEIVALKDKLKNLELENEELKHGKIQDEEMVDLNSISSLKSQLNNLILRQQDYDNLKARMAEWEKSGSNDSSLAAEIERLKAENSSLKAECLGLKFSRPILQSIVKDESEDNILVSLLEERRILVKNIGNEKSLISSLELRVHFTKMQDERSEMICLDQKEKEKSVVKTRKKVESTQRKIEKKQERISAYLQKLETLSERINDEISKNPSSTTARLASMQMALEDHKVENGLLHVVVHSMEGELNRMHADMSASLPILAKNEKLLRGHGIQSNSDKQRYAELQDRILGVRQITWAENLNNSESVELVLSVYQQCARISLPHLIPATRAESVEKRVLYSDETMANSTTLLGCDEMNSGIEQINSRPFLPIFASDAPSSTTHPTINISPASIHKPKPGDANETSNAADDTVEMNRLDDTDEIVCATPVVPVVRAVRPLELIPATPQLVRQSSNLPPGNSTTNTSFVVTPSADIQDVSLRPSEAVNMTVELGVGFPGEAELTAQIFPKRLADRFTEEEEVGTPGKKVKLDSTYCSEKTSAWMSHRPVEEIPESPLLRKCSRQENPAGENCGADISVNLDPSSPALSGLNETITLVSKLDKQCDLNSVEEAMDVDSTKSLSNISLIQPPPPGSVRLAPSPRSPVRAGLGISPTGIPRRATPSPLRQSTLLDLKSDSMPAPQQRKSPGSGFKPSNPRPLVKPGMKKKLGSSASASVLPRPGTTGPVSFRSTIQRLNGKEPDGAGSNYMQGTASSKFKIDRKPAGSKGVENPGGKKLGLKRTVSAVLKHTNK